MKKICEISCMHPAEVARVKLGRTEERELEEVAALLGAMADRTRVGILDVLRMGELCVGDLAAVLQMSVSAVSHQLRLLRTARLVRARKEGKVVFYALDDEHVERILDIALDHCRERGAP